MESSNSLTGINPKLTLVNKHSFLENLSLIISSEGPVGASIIKRIDPVTLVPLPNLNQRRRVFEPSSPTGYREILDSFTYGTPRMINGVLELDANSEPILDHSTSNYDAFDKAIEKLTKRKVRLEEF